MRYFEVQACLVYVKLILMTEISENNFYEHFEKRTDRRDMTGFKPGEGVRYWSCRRLLKL